MLRLNFVYIPPWVAVQLICKQRHGVLGSPELFTRSPQSGQ